MIVSTFRLFRIEFVEILLIYFRPTAFHSFYEKLPVFCFMEMAHVI